MNEDEQAFEELLKGFSGRLKSSEIADALDLLYNGEQGIALENVCANLYEVEVEVRPSEAELIRRLGSVWQVDPHRWDPRL
jgi:hypothetical protein